MSKLTKVLEQRNTNEISPSAAELRAILRYLIMPAIAVGLHARGYATMPVRRGGGLLYYPIGGGPIGAVNLINNNSNDKGTSRYYGRALEPLECWWEIERDVQQLRRGRPTMELACMLWELPALAAWLPAWIHTCAQGGAFPKAPVPMADFYYYECTMAAHDAVSAALDAVIARALPSLSDRGSEDLLA